MKKRFIATVFAAVIAAASVSLSAADTFREHLNKANDALKKSDFPAAIAAAKLAEKAAVNDNQKADAYFVGFRTAERDKDIEKAKVWRDSILALKDCHINKKITAARGYAWICFHAQRKDLARLAWLDFAKVDPANPALRAEAIIRVADTYWGDRSAEGKAMLEKGFRDVVEDVSLPVAKRIEAAKHLIDKVLKPQRTDEINAVADTLKNAPDLTFPDRLTIAGYEADAAFEKMDFAGIEKILKAVKTEKPEEALNVLHRIAYYNRKSQDFPKAIEVYRKIATDKNAVGHTFNLAIRNMVECGIEDNVSEKVLNDAEKLMLARPHKTPNELSATYESLIKYAMDAKDFVRAERLYTAAINIKDQTPQYLEKRKSQGFTIAYEACDMEKSRVRLDAMIAEKNPAYQQAAERYANRLFERRHLAEAAKYYACLTPDFYYHGNMWDERKALNSLRPVALLNQNNELADTAGKLSQHMRFNAIDRAQFALIAAIGKDENADIKAVIKPFALKENDLAVTLAKTGKFFVSVGRNQAAEKIFSVRTKLFKPVKRNELTIRYVKNAPTDVGAWMNSPLLKDSKNRGEVNHIYKESEAANLITDVMAAGRKVGDSRVQADKETYFYMCYDEYGLHLFFVGVDSKVKDVMAKRIGGSGYEMYLAVGEGAPAYQWLFDQPNDDDMYSPPWHSPHKYYRNLKPYVDITSRPIENGIATAMNFSWELAYDRLPENGDLWPFEIIRWTRGGGVTWGGKSVWQIGNWGRLKFDGLNKEVLREIRRVLIYKAFAAYKKQSSGRNGGLIAIWQDPELGDPDFYEKCLKADVERLNELGKLVTDDMSPETIDLLWTSAVGMWFDFQYHVAELRTKYLQERFIMTGK